MTRRHNGGEGRGGGGTFDLLFPRRGCKSASPGSFLFSRTPTHAPLPFSDGPICRICHEGAGAEELLSPCYCTGTLGTVHQSCLETWLSSSNTSFCELCKTEFSIEQEPRPLSEVKKMGVPCASSASLHLRRSFFSCEPELRVVVPQTRIGA